MSVGSVGVSLQDFWKQIERAVQERDSSLAYYLPTQERQIRCDRNGVSFYTSVNSDDLPRGAGFGPRLPISSAEVRPSHVDCLYSNLTRYLPSYDQRPSAVNKYDIQYLLALVSKVQNIQARAIANIGIHLEFELLPRDSSAEKIIGIREALLDVRMPVGLAELITTYAVERASKGLCPKGPKAIEAFIVTQRMLFQSRDVLDLSKRGLNVLPQSLLLVLKPTWYLDLTWDKSGSGRDLAMDIWEDDTTGRSLEEIEADLESSSPAEMRLTCSSKIRVMNLSGNQLTSIPQELCRIETLIELDFTGNNLLAIPAEISLLSKLETLKLGGNKNLTSLPAVLAYMPSLRYVDITGTGVDYNELSPEIQAKISSR